MVAGTTSQLCEAANLLVQGHAKEEKLIAAAKGVSQSTIQLLMACQVKADVDSESAEKLQVGVVAVNVTCCSVCLSQGLIVVWSVCCVDVARPGR